MKPVKCEICGKEIKRGPNYLGLFGQPACSEDCMSALAKKQQKKTAEKLFGKKEPK